MGSLSHKFQAAVDEGYGRKTHTFARNSYYQVPGYTVDDMEQELMQVLWSCCFDYNPKNGASFNTFFQTSCRNRISTLIRHARAQKRAAEIISLDDEDVRYAVEIGGATTESGEDIVIRRMIVREFVVEHGKHALRQLIHEKGTGALAAEAS